MGSIGENILRKESADKVTGAAKYNDDFLYSGMLYAFMVTSPYPHALINSVDTSEARKQKGVRAVITGEQSDILCGPMLEDRPLLAKGKVRYFGEPVAMVVADSEAEAKRASELIHIEYSRLPSVNSPEEALKPGAPLVHENAENYSHSAKEIYPQPGTNIAHHTRVRKGDMMKGWSESEFIAEETFKFPQSDHIAMETRSAAAEIKPDGRLIIYTTSQGPATVKKSVARYFNYELEKIIVKTSFLGGGFGGKAAVMLEFLAVLASQAAGGRLVKIKNTREQDMVTSPCHTGLEAKIKLGADKNGKIKAAELEYFYDCGAYTDSGPKMSRTGAVSGTGPYYIENIHCDSYCVYTNHPYVTAFRGFGHVWFTSAIERTMDKLAKELGMDPLELRLINAIKPGDTTPTQVNVNSGTVGNLSECLLKVSKLINWDEGTLIDIGNNKIRAKGISCLWKTSSSPVDAISGVILTMNADGTINVNSGIVEMGNSTKTTIAQILAEKMKMDVNKIYVQMETDTSINPVHWKTVASITTFMAGNAIISAADDIMEQLKEIAAIVLKCPPRDLDIADQRVFMKSNPEVFVEFKDIAHGYTYPGGNSIGGQIIGKGNFIMKHLTGLDIETGRGRPGHEWTVGAGAVEIEMDKVQCTYRLIKAACVLDAGRLLNPQAARGIVMGGMCMGLGLGSSEGFLYSDEGKVKNTSLRTYKPLRYGENPEYLVDFVQTPEADGPFGARGIAEESTLSMPAALINSLSLACGIDFRELPLTPEKIWRAKKESHHDSF